MSSKEHAGMSFELTNPEPHTRISRAIAEHNSKEGSAMSTDLHTTQLTSPVGLVAGNGTFPLEFARHAREAGVEVVAVAHKGETEQALASLVREITWVKVGQIGKMMRTFLRAGVRQVAFAGGINRVQVFGGVKPDWRGVRVLSRLRSFQDEAVFAALFAEIEKEGMSIVSASVLLRESIPPAGVLARRKLSAQEHDDAVVGWQVAKGIGRFDIGQSVVVSHGVVVAVEAVEGTDAAIRRAGTLGQRGGVLVKVSKPNQDLRIDLPTVGKKTVQEMESAGLTALVVEAGKTIMLEPCDLIAAANRAHLSVVAACSPEALSIE